MLNNVQKEIFTPYGELSKFKYYSCKLEKYDYLQFATVVLKKSFRPFPVSKGQ